MFVAYLLSDKMNCTGMFGELFPESFPTVVRVQGSGASTLHWWNSQKTVYNTYCIFHFVSQYLHAAKHRVVTKPARHICSYAPW